MKYSLPKKNKEFILIPSIDEIKTLVESNQDKLPFLEFRTQLRKSLFNESKPIVATGHQPIIYHPGIIFKDIVVNVLIKKYGFCGLNLVVDSDVLHDNHQYVSIPVFNDGTWMCEDIRLFFSEKNLAMEEIPPPDEKEFNQILAHIKERIKGSLSSENLEGLNNYITAVNKVLPYSKNLAQFNAFSKRSFEEKLDFKHTEVFLSSLCQSKAFIYFISLILSCGKQFVKCYNGILDEHRKYRKGRCPLNLRISLDTIELPFWIWKSGENRATLYIKFNRGKLWICAGDREISDIDISKIDHVIKIIEELNNFYKMRPKALMLTLFARLFLCDLWIHGVGGAEYEELNDRLAREFFSITLPEYAIASATLYLNLPEITEEEIKNLKNTLRRMKFNPEKFVGINPKEELIKKMEKAQYKKELYQQLVIINNKLKNKIISRIQDLERTIFEKENLLKIITNRQFPFFIFPLNDSGVATFEKFLLHLR